VRSVFLRKNAKISKKDKCKKLSSRPDIKLGFYLTFAITLAGKAKRASRSLQEGLGWF